MAYEAEEIRTSQEIFYYLLEHHELREEDELLLYKAYAEEEAVRNLVIILVKIVSIKVHGTTFVGQDHINNKISKFPAVLIGNFFMQISAVDGINIRTDVIHRTIFFFQRLFHNIKHYGKNKIHLLIKLSESELFPRCFLHAVLDKYRIQTHIFHSLGKIFQKFVLHCHPPSGHDIRNLWYLIFPAEYICLLPGFFSSCKQSVHRNTQKILN